MVSDAVGEYSESTSTSLNPCFNGIWSRPVYGGVRLAAGMSLNPCFNGIWSRTHRHGVSQRQAVQVLILVLMEYGLGHDQDGNVISRELLS